MHLTKFVYVTNSVYVYNKLCLCINKYCLCCFSLILLLYKDKYYLFIHTHSLTYTQTRFAIYTNFIRCIYSLDVYHCSFVLCHICWPTSIHHPCCTNHIITINISSPPNNHCQLKQPRFPASNSHAKGNTTPLYHVVFEVAS